MKLMTDLRKGAVIKAAELRWSDEHGCRVCYPVGPHNGATAIHGTVVEIPPGACWPPAGTAFDMETNGVVAAGVGTASIGAQTVELAKATAIYAPTGATYAIRADRGSAIRLFFWQSRLPEGAPVSRAPRLVTEMWNDETQFVGFEGTDQEGNARYGAADHARMAVMHFLLWPGTGAAHLCLHCGIMQPGQEFGVHTHPISEEVFIGFEGRGQCHLDGHWYDMEEGDILYAPPGMPHGTRHPYTAPGTGRFVTCGGPTPFDVKFYQFAGVSPELK